MRGLGGRTVDHARCVDAPQGIVCYEDLDRAERREDVRVVSWMRAEGTLDDRAVNLTDSEAVDVAHLPRHPNSSPHTLLSLPHPAHPCAS